MPTPLVVGDIIETKVFSKLGEQVAINVYHYRCSAFTGVSRTDQEIANSMESVGGPKYKAAMPGAALHLGTTVQIIQGGVLPVRAVSVTEAGVGARAADALAPQLAVLVRKNTGIAGRANRGRVYLPFFAEDEEDANGEVNAAGQAAATVIAAYYLNQINIAAGGSSVTLDPIIWQRTDRTYVNITSYTVRSLFATQRRRSLINKPDAFGP